MALSTAIGLPRSHTARFPDRCVVCNAPSPNAHVRLTTGTLGWWTWVLWIWGKPFVAKAPACKRCAWKLHGLRWISLAVTIAISLAALFLIWPHLKPAIPHWVRKWAMMALALLCVLPQIIVEVFFAKPFDMTAWTDSVDYEFTSKDYAVDFAVLNADADWVKVDGEIISQSPEKQS